MKIDTQQKKYIKKWLKKKRVADIATELNIDEADILSYLKQRWGVEKFNRFTEQNQIFRTASIAVEQPTAVTSTPQTEMVQNEAVHLSILKWISARWLQIFVLFVLIAIIYFNTLDNAFLSDDIAGLLGNTHIGDLNYIFSHPLSAIGGLEYYIIYKIFGLSPTFYHLNNIIFHFFNCVAIYLVVEMLTNKRVGLLSATLFAVHPLQTEAVTWVSGGLVSHSAFFVLVAMILFIKSLGKSMLDKRYILAVFMYFIGVYFSEKNMGFPLILVVLLFAMKKIKQGWYKTIPFFLISAIWAATYISMIPARAAALHTEYSTATTAGNPFVQVPTAITSYWQLIIFPRALTFYHTQLVLSSSQLAFRFIITMIVLMMGLYSLKKGRQIFFWLAFFVLALSPTLSSFGLSSLVAERYVYLGALGIYVVFAILIDPLLVKAKTQNIITGILVIIVILLMGRTYLRNQDWQNQDTLWLATEVYSPNSPQNSNNLGDYYGRMGDANNAIKYFQRAIALNPNYAHAHHNLANIYAQTDQLDLALNNYKMAAQLNPYQWQSYQQIALIYYYKKDMTNALIYIKQAIALNPNDPTLIEQKEIIEGKRQP